MWIQNCVAPSDHVKTSPMRQAQKWISHAKGFAGLRCAADDFFFSLELQRNGSGTTSTEIGLAVCGVESPGPTASNFVPELLNPRFTYPSAISFPSRSLRVALVIQPASFPAVEGTASFIPGRSGTSFTEINPHNRLFVWPDIFIREITSWPM